MMVGIIGIIPNIADFIPVVTGSTLGVPVNSVVISITIVVGDISNITYYGIRIYIYTYPIYSGWW